MVERILDIGCGVGGAAMGLHRVFPDAEIHGVDIVDQPNYPFTFLKGDMLELDDFTDYDLVWLSAPCQLWSIATPEAYRPNHVDLITPMRWRLLWSGVPFVIENVVGAPLRADLVLCGPMVGLHRLYRHRVFEASFPMAKMKHPPHRKFRGWKDDDIVTVAGGGSGSWSDVGTWRLAMGIDWAKNTRELAQAVPPAYSEYIAHQFRDGCSSCNAAVQVHGGDHSFARAEYGDYQCVWCRLSHDEHHLESE